MYMTYINRLKIKSIAHSRDDTDIFVINRKIWIDCMKELQVSETLSEKWCGHLAWRKKIVSRCHL